MNIEILRRCDDRPPYTVYSLTLRVPIRLMHCPQNADTIVETVSNAIIDVVGGSCRFCAVGLFIRVGCWPILCSTSCPVKHQQIPSVALIDTYLPSQIANPSMNEGFSPNDTGKGPFP